jgi:hypothetical protein
MSPRDRLIILLLVVILTTLLGFVFASGMSDICRKVYPGAETRWTIADGCRPIGQAPTVLEGVK